MKLKYILLTFLLLGSLVKLHADDISLIVSGEGASKDLAIKNALVSAVEQAYGVYVSSDTKILNDELIRDEIVQIKQGNVKNYTVLAANLSPNNNYSVMLSATVSTDKLLKFAQSKGAVCELAGRTLAANIALKKLYLQNGADGMDQLYHTLGYIAPKIYDYRLNLSEPVIDGKDVYIPVAIDCVLNSNFDSFIEIYTKTHNSIMSSIRSVNVQGLVGEESVERINKLNSYILKLPETWIFGFAVKDNIGSSLIPYVNSLDKDSKNYFWPDKFVEPFKVIHAGMYNGEDKYVINGLPPHSYVICVRERMALALKAKGMQVYRLDKGKDLCREYIRSIKYECAKRKPTIAHTDVWPWFEYWMVDWSDGIRLGGKVPHNWLERRKGEKVCTIHFILCYNDDDVARISDIKITPIVNL